MMETKRCLIKPIHWDDFDSYVESSKDPEVVQYIGDGKVISREEHYQKWLDRMAYMEQNPGFGSFTVFLKSTGEQMGSCNVNQLDDTDLKHLGYRIYKEYWGQGYATEVAAAARDHALGTMKLDLITAAVDIENTASQRVLDKIGMNYMGIRHLYKIDLKYYELTQTDYGKL